MVGWGLSERPDLLFDSGDSDNDFRRMMPWGISELGDAICTKPGNEGVPVLFLIANALEIEIKGEKNFAVLTSRDGH